MISNDARVAALYLDLGQDPSLRQRAESILAEMRSLVCVEVSDFLCFRTAVIAAANQEKPFEIKNRALLDAVLFAGNDEQAVMQLLNRDPVHSQIPFVEQIPVERGGATVWVTPIEHPHIQKRASDSPRFERLIQDLVDLYKDSHPARFERPRLNLLDALARLRRELKRDHCYLPAAMQLVEVRVANFQAESIEPAALASAETLRRLLLACDQIQTSCQQRWMNKSLAAALRRQAAELGALYIDNPGLHRPWLTSNILGTLLAPAHMDVRWRPRMSKSVALLRNELQTGSYDPMEISARIRKLEAKGLYISSLAFPLLQLHIDGEDRSIWKSEKALAP